MKNKKNKKTRSDRPSGRQTMAQPEHNDEETPDRASLNQGQGPDFQTQDKILRKKNPGVTRLEKESHQQQIDQPVGKPEHPKRSRKRDE